MLHIQKKKCIGNWDCDWLLQSKIQLFPLYPSDICVLSTDLTKIKLQRINFSDLIRTLEKFNFAFLGIVMI